MKRYGTVITFKDGVTREQAVEALNALAPLLELPKMVAVPEYHTDEDGQIRVRFGRRPFTLDDAVHEYDPVDDGEPIWHVPEE